MANNSSFIPLLGWDPTNPLVAWSCDCLSETNIIAKGGVWQNGAARAYDPVYGMYQTSFLPAAALLFDLAGFINYLSVPNYQLSFDIETSFIIAYVANSLYFTGRNRPGTQRTPFMNISDNGSVNSGEWDYGFGTQGTNSGHFIRPGNSATNIGAFQGGISNVNKNLMTRLILVKSGKLFQIWAEHHDSAGNRIGIALLTDSSIHMDPTIGFNGNWNKQTDAVQPIGLRYLYLFYTGGSADLTSINCRMRNLQLVTSAPTETSHPVLRLLAGTGDSYGQYFNSSGNFPNPANTNISAIGNAITLDMQSDSQTLIRALSLVKHQTGILNHACIAMEQGGNTICKYSTDRLTQGTPNKYIAYMTTDYKTPCGNGAPTKTQLIRANLTIYNAGDMIVPATATGFVYSCVVAGTSAATPPIFGTTILGTTIDGGVTWVANDYDMYYAEAGIVRKRFSNPSLLLHMEGYNDSDFIQQNLNNPAVYPLYAGYGGIYANNYVLFDTTFKLWMQSLLDLYPELIVLLYTLPIAPNAITLANVTDPLGIGRVPAINLINATYRAAPDYFQALISSNSNVDYKGRVHCMDYARDTGITSLAVSNVALFPDGTHPSSKYMQDVLVDTTVRGIKLAMSGTKTNKIS